jgi:hypothetical protein
MDWLELASDFLARQNRLQDIPGELIRDYNRLPHWAHRRRNDGKHSPLAVLGAEACIFSSEIGQMLGIDTEAGEPKWFGSASGGTLEMYGTWSSLNFSAST